MFRPEESNKESEPSIREELTTSNMGCGVPGSTLLLWLERLKTEEGSVSHWRPLATESNYLLVNLLPFARRTSLPAATGSSLGAREWSPQSRGCHGRLCGPGQLPADRELVRLHTQMDGLVAGLKTGGTPSRNKLLGGRNGLAGGGSDGVAASTHVLQGIRVGATGARGTGGATRARNACGKEKKSISAIHAL